MWARQLVNKKRDACDHLLIHLLFNTANMSAEECPPEIWEIIFSLACRDDGSTALALSQVSRSINAYSKPYRYQSVALTRCEQIIAFGSVISSLPPELRRVKNLFVHNPLPYVYTSDIYDSDEDSDATNDGSQRADPALPEEGLSGKASAFKEFGEAQDAEYEPDSDAEQSHSSDLEDSFDGLTAEEQVELAEEIQGIHSEKIESPSDWKIGSTPDWLKEFLSDFENHQYAILNAFRLILETVAPTLESLTVHFIMYQHCPLEVIIPELPVLRDLSLYRMRPYHSNRPDLLWPGFPTVFPSLKRLQIEGYLEPSASLLTKMAPSLECLHTSEDIFECVKFLPELRRAAHVSRRAITKGLFRSSVFSSAFNQNYPIEPKLFLPETLRKIVIHTGLAEDMTSHRIKRKLFGGDYEEGVGKYAEFVAEPYSEEYEDWMGDWVARISGKGDAVSIELGTGDAASVEFQSTSDSSGT